MPAKLPVVEWIHQLAAEVHETKEETMKVQLELNLQIIELQLQV